MIDEDRHVRNSCAELLEAFDWEVRTMSGGAGLSESLGSFPASGVLTDVRTAGMSELDLLEALKTTPAAPPVVLFTAHGDIAMAVDAMRAGAYDFMEKPYEAERLGSTLERAAALHQTRLKAQLLRSRLLTMSGFDRNFIGQSAETRDLRNKVMSLLDVSAPILIRGETGTGKHLVARAQHDLGRPLRTRSSNSTAPRWPRTASTSSSAA